MEGRIRQGLEKQSENQKGGTGKPQCMIRKSGTPPVMCSVYTLKGCARQRLLSGSQRHSCPIEMNLRDAETEGSTRVQSL